MLNEEWERYAQETGAIKDGKLSRPGIYMKLGFYAGVNVIIKQMIDGEFSQMDCIADIIEHSNSIKDEVGEYEKWIASIQKKAKEESKGRDRQQWHPPSTATWSPESYTQGASEASGDEQSQRDSGGEQSTQEDA